MGYLFHWSLLSKAATESALDASEIVILVSGIVLAIGAIGEYLEEHNRLPRWTKLVFIWMVVISLIGEFAGDGGVFVFSGHLQSISDSEVENLRSESAKNNLEAARLRAAIADRELTPKQQEDIRASMKLFTGREVYIRSYPNDPEAERLIVAIKSSLEPYIHVEDRTGQLGPTWANAGVILGIRVESETGERSFAGTLIKSLRHDGNLSVEDLSEFSSDGPTEILVGMKPVALARQLATVQQRALDRRLRPAQQRKIASELCRFTAKYLQIGVYNSDGEIEQIAEDLKEALEQCEDSGHFVVSTSRQTVTHGFSGMQLVFTGKLPDKDRSLAEAIVKDLRREGLQIDGPIPEPSRGRPFAGGGTFQRTNVDSITGAPPPPKLEAAGFEIAIGKKP